MQKQKNLIKFGQILVWLYGKLIAATVIKTDVSLPNMDGIAKEKPLIIISNHVSHLDPYLLMGSLSWRELRIISPMKVMMAKWYFHSPLMPFAWLMGCFPARPLLKPFKKWSGTAASIRYLKKGYSLGIYPEGKRVFEDKQEPHYGVIKIMQSIESYEAHVLLCHINRNKENGNEYFISIEQDDSVLKFTEPSLVMDRLFSIGHNV
ncbi:1-acyl-sn-glycerol-3-phosphate acyltransferase [Candidatus Saccharibacteria bacterium]|nr:1-acyl-sn-glycerol-3-phosphate acyltransferase [Candidatus Saccharibacteria bacterium]